VGEQENGPFNVRGIPKKKEDKLPDEKGPTLSAKVQRELILRVSFYSGRANGAVFSIAT